MLVLNVQAEPDWLQGTRDMKTDMKKEDRPGMKLDKEKFNSSLKESGYFYDHLAKPFRARES
jgi:hypothetical protein